MVYIDTHKDLKVSDELVGQITGAIRSGKRNEFGVKPLNFLYTKEGRAFCVNEAPSPEAVRREHDAMGVKCDEILPVNCLNC